MKSTPFQVEYQPLSTTKPVLGSISLLPWDCETFGFNVAEFVPSDEVPEPELGSILQRWATEHQALLISAQLPAGRADWLLALQQAGFYVVDCVVSLTSKHNRKVPEHESPLPLRLARAEELAELEQIALDAFSSGRYFADPLFPKELAKKRYAVWVKNALTGQIPGGMVLVAEHQDEIAGFLVERVENGHSQGQLACVNPKFKNGIFMYSLLTAHGAWMRENGIPKATTGQISVGLLQVINLNLAIHSTLGQPSYILHWHAPDFATKCRASTAVK